MGSTKIKEGDTVWVAVPTCEIQIKYSNIIEYSETKQTVSRIRYLGTGFGSYAELEGICSEHGVPYVFMSDWLHKLDE